MKMGPFSYSVSAEVTLTGEEVKLLEDCARAHYDFKSRNFFTPGMGGVGSSWRNWFMLENDNKLPEDFFEGTVKIKMTSTLLDRCLKILEMGRLVGISPALAIGLTVNFKKAFYTLQNEFLRLNPQDPEDLDVSSP